MHYGKRGSGVYALPHDFGQILKFLYSLLFLKRPTIDDKIVDTMYSNRVSSENKRIHTPALSPPFKVAAELARTVAQHCMDGMGEEKLDSPF